MGAGDIKVCFLGDRYLVRSYFRLGLSMGFSKLESLGQIASFERRPPGGGSNAPHHSAPRRERGWGLSETSEKCEKCIFLGGICLSYSLDLGIRRA